MAGPDFTVPAITEYENYKFLTFLFARRADMKRHGTMEYHPVHHACCVVEQEKDRRSGFSREIIMFIWVIQ